MLEDIIQRNIRCVNGSFFDNKLRRTTIRSQYDEKTTINDFETLLNNRSIVNFPYQMKIKSLIKECLNILFTSNNECLNILFTPNNIAVTPHPLSVEGIVFTHSEIPIFITRNKKYDDYNRTMIWIELNQINIPSKL